jgi:hypothetical protein
MTRNYFRIISVEEVERGVEESPPLRGPRREKEGNLPDQDENVRPLCE